MSATVNQSSAAGANNDAAAGALRVLLARYGDGQVDDIKAQLEVDTISKQYGVSASTLRNAFHAEAKMSVVRRFGAGRGVE